MDADLIIKVVFSLGFPMVLSGALLWFIYVKSAADRESNEKMWDSYRQDIKELNATHKSEVNMLRESLDNNTLMMTKLYERLGGDSK